MNESGYSWPEAILTLAVTMLIFCTLLPVVFTMVGGLEGKKAEMHAKETLYQGALLHTSYGLMSGYRDEEGGRYSWTVQAGRVCVSYERQGKGETLCTS
ncbi:hypothetical protein NCCP2716_05900 [Sporosarcina sp. NCCP-2716]|uniref:hypothetical protein n=1 Tax=Sporosarcina sp. NCCP-2716 TaxID=2943679 RepID=UPI002040A3E5|nr:hypothetical protein [Sporosarcina sp. NCCP-2716]GKV68092.1 hypothetical protein NCCP2716_05900 [Sporosarcina sp. NCCP-2716]